MSEPIPGSGPKSPVWVADVPHVPTTAERVSEAITVAARIVGLVYTLMTAWQVAKMLNPPLQVKQDLAIAALKQKFAKIVDELPELANEDRAAIYNDLRG
jgi:hypothetical protein